jgi:hypothetical protein
MGRAWPVIPPPLSLEILLPDLGKEQARHEEHLQLEVTRNGERFENRGRCNIERVVRYYAHASAFEITKSTSLPSAPQQHC